MPVRPHQAPLSATTSLYTLDDYTNERTQLAILERFATRLVTETVETPQAALDAINDRFWDLI